MIQTGVLSVSPGEFFSPKFKHKSGALSLGILLWVGRSEENVEVLLGKIFSDAQCSLLH